MYGPLHLLGGVINMHGLILEGGLKIKVQNTQDGNIGLHNVGLNVCHLESDTCTFMWPYNIS